MSSRAQYMPLDFQRVSLEEQQTRSQQFRQQMSTRRTVRMFSPEPVPYVL